MPRQNKYTELKDEYSKYHNDGIEYVFGQDQWRYNRSWKRGYSPRRLGLRQEEQAQVNDCEDDSRRTFEGWTDWP